jgi:hypothetical protein
VDVIQLLFFIMKHVYLIGVWLQGEDQRTNTIKTHIQTPHAMMNTTKRICVFNQQTYTSDNHN